MPIVDMYLIYFMGAWCDLLLEIMDGRVPNTFFSMGAGVGKS